ncbi:MAG TPA: ABC transporter permease subunit [Candidatus Nanopelagicaceae bacterium]|nr:ABC transporter permease subunit [Candidatus Nanopelagicaceae bacterium]
MSTELVLGPLRSLRRATLLWAGGLALLVAGTVAVWPEFKGSSAISHAVDKLPPAVLRAFGLGGFGTPAGFLRGNLYAFVVPLLLTAVAIYFVNSLTAAEEEGGRLEQLLAQPVTRAALFAGRATAALVAILLIAAATALVQFAADAAFGLSIGADHLGATLLLSTLLALFQASVALAVAGFAPRPSTVLGVAFGVTMVGMVWAAIVPLVPQAAGLAHVSPWDWALGGDPLVSGAASWRYLALVFPTLVLSGLGVWAFSHRDISSG